MQTREETQVYVHDLELFVTVQIFEDSPAAFSLGKLCEEHGYSYEWTSGQKPQLMMKVGKSFCATRKTSSYWCIVSAGLTGYLSKTSNTTK